MRLSESLRRNIMVTAVGGILNKFKGKSRRTTLFFEDVLADYIKMCEDCGYGSKMRCIGEMWGSIGTKQLSTLRLFKSTALLNQIAKIAWLNVGLMDDFVLTKKDKKILIETKNEFITRLIGKNEFIIGFFMGCLDSYFGKKIEFVRRRVSGLYTKYDFEITKVSYSIRSKDKNKYNKLNMLHAKQGFTLKNALESKTFNLKGNRIYFRNRSVLSIENTIFHIIGNENIMVENVSSLSYNFFKEIIDKQATPEKKLTLLKTLLQVMGLCSINMSQNKDEIRMKINGLPVGLQIEKDNWSFISQVIRGYLWLLDKRYTIHSTVQGKTTLDLVFVKGMACK